ncbi:uncharacterized protein GGS22DRAFT_74781 [Annulohypoxylon maeteangense]|uniref:uncharacterized protein n=1 Tax=Annulohypoxylon maeteangense TaxID=1927788 RepID=UPI00200726D7|nr:uncharacterized protein GGS22DRAFT_74781 [Annulohypoxylon maeteangense]KAI0881030.1 hypothetical protein GGS22DRAFT_74781 [Annulohypoxylon maeteangense]
MMGSAPPLPTRFPCWCRAVYSWGGESQHDLGFIEGDLIECLNAGDGSWWTGRLRRNKTVGVFPSNFVEVLPDDFRPITRSASPLTSSHSPSPTNTPHKSKSRNFRKPFEAYAKAPHYTTAKQPEIIRTASNTPPRKNSASSFRNDARRGIDRGPSPAEARGHGSRGPSPAPPLANSYAPRGASPIPPMHSHSHSYPQAHPRTHSRGPSPVPPQGYDYSRGPSPVPPPGQQQYGSRAPSPAPSFSFKPYRPGAERDSPPPPAPPPHRHVITRGNSNASHMSRASFDNRRQEGYHTPRVPSPLPQSPAGDGYTPSPLREAMDGVIEQLDALGMTRERSTESPEPHLDPWSPESFDLVHRRSRKRAQTRPLASRSMPFEDSGYGGSFNGGSSQESTYHGNVPKEHPLPQLNNYVERMENRFRKMHHQSSNAGSMDNDDMGPPPPPPPKNPIYSRPKSSMGDNDHGGARKFLRKQKSSYEVGVLDRTGTNKTNSTNASSGNRSTATNSTQRSLMSGVSAGGISATSAGSLARKNFRARSALGFRDADNDDDWDPNRPVTPFTGVSYHPSHSTSAMRPQSQAGFNDDGIASIGGLVQPGTTKPKKQNFIKRILEATKTGVAGSRSSIATGSGSGQASPTRRSIVPNGITALAGGASSTNLVRDAATDMGLTNGVDWVQVRRDVNRSNTLSKNERTERRDRCLMLDYPAIDPVDELYESVQGDEGADSMPVREPINYQVINLSQVDKNSRFISSLPSMTTAVTLATTYVCRPYKSEVQRLRAIFTWVAEKVNWEEDFDGDIDTRRAISTKRACSEEYAVLVHEMCAAIGIPSEVIRGYLKTPGEVPETGMMPRSNHFWNAVIIDNEWRMIDCCLASPSNPRRGLYSGASSAIAESWYFLTRPSELCWTHIPEHHSQQHICPPVAHETLLNLPGACPPFFKQAIAMVDYNTSLTRIEDLEMVHIKFNVPPDIEVAAEVEVRGFTRDADGDFFENGEVVKKRALAQADWYNGGKRYTVKALLPGDEGSGILKVYAGKRGLMHSIKDIPHPLAFALPIMHTGENPPYEFVTRHPTPHAQRHDIYVVQPQCQRLALNNTFVFAIRQHPSFLSGGPSSNPGGTSPTPYARPGSAMSMSSSAAASNPSSATGSIAGKKPAKLAIQTPGGKILRLMRKEDRSGRGGIGVGGRTPAEEEASDGGTWETIIKCSERGVWRGLVLADRTARWCVFAEWVCI